MAHAVRSSHQSSSECCLEFALSGHHTVLGPVRHLAVTQASVACVLGAKQAFPGVKGYRSVRGIWDESGPQEMSDDNMSGGANPSFHGSGDSDSHSHSSSHSSSNSASDTDSAQQNFQQLLMPGLLRDFVHAAVGNTGNGHTDKVRGPLWG